MLTMLILLLIEIECDVFRKGMNRVSKKMIEVLNGGWTDVEPI
jgi:hypothetical protein